MITLIQLLFVVVTYVAVALVGVQIGSRLTEACLRGKYDKGEYWHG